MEITLFVILFYLLPATICWFFVRWSVKNGFETEPDMYDVFLTIAPIFNVIMTIVIIIEFIEIMNHKGKDFSKKFFKL